MADKKKMEFLHLTGDARIMYDRRLFDVGHFYQAKKNYIPETLSEHRARREEVIRRIKLAAGLNPMPYLPKNPSQVSLSAVYENVLIYNVEIETLPGLRLTGNFFVPENADKKLPGILCPHGHWEFGRVHHDERGGVVMRCFEFARLGFAVFAYDMVGYNDCNDLPHSFGIELKAYADLYGVSTFGLQTVNSMRAVDFLVERPEVDSDKIGCTGASGGASQTWFIAALDKRIKVIAPVCMLSSSFQGGCDCEEGALLRVNGLSNFDILASLAPMPMILPSVDGDWTNANPVYEIPCLKKVYKLYNAEDNIENFHYDDVHNYNQRTREHIYAWFVRHLKGEDRGITIAEEKITPPAAEILWHKGAKPDAPDAVHIRETVDKIAEFYTADALDYGDDLVGWQNDRREVLREMISSDTATSDVARQHYNMKWDVADGIAFPELLMCREKGDVVVNVYYCPSDKKTDKAFLLVLPKNYDECMEGARFYPQIKDFMQKGMCGCSVELLGNPRHQEMLKSSLCQATERSHHAAFNHSLFSMRVQDIITAYTRLREDGHNKVIIVAPPETAPETLAAMALLNTPEAVIDLDGLDEAVWTQAEKHQVLIHKIGGLAGLVLINCRNGVSYINVPPYMKKFIE